MGKTVKGKEKAKAKIAKANRKIARKCKSGLAVASFALASMLLNGCATSDAKQPAKAVTMDNKFDDCIIVIAAKARIPVDGTNRVVEVDGGNLPSVEMFTQTQSLENSGTDTTTQSATQTPTTDVKPDVDVTVPVTKGAGGAAGDAVASLVSGAIKGATSSGNAQSSGCTGSDCTPASTCTGSDCKPASACTGGACKD